MAVAGQADFGAGIYRGREAPDNAAYDLLNCLIDDEGQPLRRGGSAYKSNANAGATLLGLADLALPTGARTPFWSSASLFVLAADDATPFTVTTSIGALARMLRVGRLAVGVSNPTSTQAKLVFYGGSRKAQYTTGTVTVALNSKTVTGAGTLWAANADAGMIFGLNGPLNPDQLGHYVVEQVVGDTQLILATAYTANTLPGAASSYTLAPAEVATVTVASPACVGTVARRLLVGVGERVYFTAPDTPFEWVNGVFVGSALASSIFPTTALYHEFPGGTCLGIEGLGRVGIVCMTDGMWVIENMDLDATDDAGNVQHSVQQINEMILWGDPGLAQWRGATVVPAVDNVWLVSLGQAPVPIGDAIRPLYLPYVQAGYQPGLATVHRGHYFLPILNGTTLVDMLVCRLDRGFAWTRWSGHGAGVAYAQRIGSTTRSPKLYSVASQRVTELTDAWVPSASNASEADATTHTVTIETRDLPTPGGAKGSTTRKVRVRYQATAAATPTFTVSYARGPEDAAYTSLGTALRGGSTSDGLDESVWPVAKQAPAIRFRITSSSALSSFTLRSVEAHFTERGA